MRKIQIDPGLYADVQKLVDRIGLWADVDDFVRDALRDMLRKYRCMK